MRTAPTIRCPLRTLTPDYITRLNLAYSLYRYFKQDYQLQTNTQMPGNLKSYLLNGLIITCCCLHTELNRNCLFRRAGFICFMWTRGLGARDLIPETLVSGIEKFLTAEGAVLATTANRDTFRNEVIDEVKDIERIPLNTLPRAWKMYRKLPIKFAKFWVCSHNNERIVFEGKLCHA